MTRNEWIALAEEFEEKAVQAVERGDEVACEMFNIKAQACRHNAVYIGKEEPKQAATVEVA